MIKTRTVLQYTLLALLSLSPLAYFGYQKYQENHFSCQGEVMIFKDNSYYTSIMNYRFDGGSGILDAKGFFKKDGAEIAKINKKLAFNYWWEGKSLIMVSDNKYDDKETVALLNTLTPDFFLYSDRGMTIQLKRQNASSYLFTQSGAPLFSCLISKSSRTAS